MKKKGFTLIDVIASVVILALIALITAPIVFKVIEQAKIGGAERGADRYLKTVKTVVGAERMGGKILEGEYEIQWDGNLCAAEQTCTDDTKIIIDMKGKKPDSGVVFIENGEIGTESIITIGDYVVRYNDEKKLVASHGPILVEQIIIEYPTAYYESNGKIVYNAMTEYKDYVPKITVLPRYASNKSIELEFIGSSNDTFNSNTGVISHTKPWEPSDPHQMTMSYCNTATVKAKALDGSGVIAELKIKSMDKDPSRCYSWSPWQ